MTTITIPRETFDKMLYALEVLNHLDADINFLNTNELEEMMEKALSAAKAVSETKVQPTITNSESRSPIAHLRARTSQHKWNSYELCQADDPNGIAVYAHPQASEPACDRAYLNGLRSGFGYGISGDESGYQKSANSYRAMLAAAPEATK